MLVTNISQANNRQEANDLYEKGMAFYKKGDFKRAAEILEKFLPSFEKILSEEQNKNLGQKLIGDTNQIIGDCYKNISNYSRALEFFINALKFYKAAEEKEGQGYVLDDIHSFCCIICENPNVALLHYQQMLTIHKKIGDNKGALFDLTYIIGYIGKLTDAIEYVEEKQKLREKMKIEVTDEFDLFANDLEQLAYYEQTLIIHKRIGDVEDERHDLVHIGLNYWKLGNYQKAFEFFEKIKETFTSLEDKDNPIK